MIQLLFFDSLDSIHRTSVIVSASLFAFAEGLILILIQQNIFAAYLMGAIGMLVLGIFIGRNPQTLRTHFIPPPYADILVYCAILLMTIQPAFLPFPGSIANGLLLSRLDIELFLFGFLIVMIAIVFPSANDIHLHRIRPNGEDLRPVEYLSSIPFGLRRCVTAVIAIVILAVVVLAFLSTSKGPLGSAILILIFGCILPFVFEHAYGYHSYIMRIFGITLFAEASFALILRSPYAASIPAAVMQIAGWAWSTAWVGAAYQIWQEENLRQLILQQKFWHSVYLGIFGLGHVALYVFWIIPVLGQGT